MVVEGEQVVVGDVAPGAEVAYEVLCRRHHMRQVTARASTRSSYIFSPTTVQGVIMKSRAYAALSAKTDLGSHTSLNVVN